MNIKISPSNDERCCDVCCNFVVDEPDERDVNYCYRCLKGAFNYSVPVTGFDSDLFHMSVEFDSMVCNFFK